jgi:6,7-dimethyl-8-ribityllumazine synthase
MSTAQHSNVDLNKLPSSKGRRFALVASEWNSEITDNLKSAARETLLKTGVKAKDIEEYNVPGSFELIHACKVVSESLEFDAVIAIGSIIRGETSHFDYVCQGVSNGIALLNANGKIPVILCVLTDDNMQQSIDRSGGKYGNKGVEASIAAIKMASF